MLKFSLLYTTARPWMIPEVVSLWKDGNPHEMIVVTDQPVEHTTDAEYFVNSGPANCVAGWNLAATLATGDVFVQVSDDTIPPPNWAQRIQAAIVSDKTVLNLLDLSEAKDRTHHPVLTAKAYRAAGTLYPPDFESLWCDTWFHEYHSRFSDYYQSRGVFWPNEESYIQDAVAKAHHNRVRSVRGHRLFVSLFSTFKSKAQTVKLIDM